MTDREICGVCRGQWPCECAPHAAPVVMMESVDDEYATALARRMGEDRNAPLSIRPYELEPPLKVHGMFSLDEYCGHYKNRFDLDTDKKMVWCRHCGTILDPYEVLEKLGRIDRRLSERLAAAQELEQRESVREDDRKARARVRRHRYAETYSRRSEPGCATCGLPRENAIHTSKEAAS